MRYVYNETSKERLDMKNNSRFGVWVLIPGFVLAFAARMAQLCAGTDMTSGFLKHDNGFFMNACFWAAVIISIGGAVAAAVFDRKRGSAFYQTPVSEESNISPSPFMMWVDFIFGAAMLVVAFLILYYKEFKPGLGFATVSGAAFYTLRGIGIFMEKMAVTTVPEYLINCISVILAAVFFMQLAKFLSGNEGKHTREVLAVSGTAAAVTILGNSIAGLAAMLFGPAETASRIVLSSYEAEWLYQANYGESAYYMSLVPAADAAAGVFIVVVLLALFMKPKKQEVPTEESAD